MKKTIPIARLESILNLDANELCFECTVVLFCTMWPTLRVQVGLTQADLFESHWKKGWTPPVAIFLKQLMRRKMSFPARTMISPRLTI